MSNQFKLQEIVKDIHSKFVYKRDKNIFESWRVLKLRNNAYTGDCEDFSLTVIWHLCDRSFFKFVFNFMILHKYRIYSATDMNGEGHACGYAEGLFFDNWGPGALPKADFIKLRKHKIRFFYPVILMLVPFLAGAIKS